MSRIQFSYPSFDGINGETQFHLAAHTGGAPVVTVVSNGSPEIVSDDFNRLELGDAWTFIDPVGDSTLVLDGTAAVISVPGGTSHDIWTGGILAPHLMQAAPNADFEIEARFETLPTGTNAVQGLLVQADATNFLRFDVTSSVSDTKLFAAVFTNGSPSVRLNQDISRGLPLHLRITRVGDEWTLRYSLDGATWTTAVSTIHVMTVTQVGFFVGNAGSQPPAFTGAVDFFFNTAQPIDPINPDQSLNTSPPVVSQVSRNVMATSLEISWFTNKPASSTLQFGTTPSFELGAVTDSEFRYMHTITIPDLQPQTTYQFQILSTGLNDLTSTSGTFLARTTGIDTGSPVIDVWYGSEQTFAHVGHPQRWMNVLGKVTSPNGISSLTYSLNGGPSSPLSVGPNGDRLVATGDFNIELDRWLLEPGVNTVTITAVDAQSNETVRDVTVNYQTGNAWPSPYEIDWSAVADINDVAQVVDGSWAITNEGVRPLEIGYDRLIGIGEITWEDYEIVVPVTINGFGTTYPPAVGVVARWAGHYPHDNAPENPQPRWEWRPLGAIGWYEWSIGLNCFRLSISGDSAPIVEDETCRQLEVGSRYIFKLRVETVDSTYSQYRFKVWRDGEPEPSAWDLSALKSGHLMRGSVLLVAQDIDAVFGNVSITPLSEPSGPPDPGGPPPQSTIQSDDFNVNGTELSEFWTFINPVGDSSLKLDGLKAKISVPAGVDHDVWTSAIRAPRLMQSVQNSDFEIAAKFDTQPQGTHAMQGMLVKADDFNFIRFDFYSSGTSLNVFAATFNNGVATVRANQSVPNGDELYLRITRVGSSWTLAFSHNGIDWMTAATFNYTVVVSQVGVFVGNAGPNPPGYTGAIDYFFNTASPIDPVNANPPPPPPASTIQSDDFNVNGTELSSFWTFVDPMDDSSLDLDGLHAKIGVASGSNHDVWITGNFAPRLMQAANDTDFEIAVKFDSQPQGTHAMQGLLVEADALNFIRLDFYSTGTGLNLFAATFSSGTPTVRANLSVDQGSPLYLRVTRVRDTWTLAYSYDGSVWIDVTVFTHVLEVTQVGVFVANVAPETPSYTGAIDYFFNTASPIDPVNANPPPPPPASTVQSDDFNVNGTALSSFWTFVDPVGDSTLTLDGLHARISVPAGIDHDVWTGGVRAPRLMQAVNDADFEIESRFASIPAGTHATQGLLIYDDDQNFIRFDFYSTGTNLHLFAGSVSSGNPVIYANQGVPHGDLLYLRIARQRDAWTLRYSTNGSDWPAVAAFNHVLAVGQVGVFVGNAGSSPPGYTGSIDYFFNTASPIDPVNANPPPSPPASNIMSDDFSSTELAAFWTFVDPVGDSTMQLDGAHATVSAPSGSDHDLWVSANRAPRLMQAANDTDFEIAVKFDSQPQGACAMQGLIVQSSDSQLLRYDYYSCGSSLGIFAGVIGPGGSAVYANQGVASGLPLYLRISRVGDGWSLAHSYDGENWSPVATFAHVMIVTHVGVFVGNAAPELPGMTGLIDSFTSTADP